MTRDAFITDNDYTKTYECIYYHDPKRWSETPTLMKQILNNQSWSDYIKYLDGNGHISDKINQLPNDEGGIYMFFIQGQTLPSSEMYLAYIGRARCTTNQNIRKRVKEYLRESSRKNGRHKIKRLFRYWKDYLYIRYFSTKDTTLIEEGERTLIRAVLPPFNDDIPDKIEYKAPQNAF